MELDIRTILRRLRYQQGEYPAWEKIEWTQVCCAGGSKLYSTLPFFCGISQ